MLKIIAVIITLNLIYFFIRKSDIYVKEKIIHNDTL